MSVLLRIRTSLRCDGLSITILKLCSLCVDHLFDIRYGIDTCKCSQLAELTIFSDNIENGFQYQPTRVVLLRKLFKAIKPMIPADSVIVDLGCGKGRVLLVALERDFREVRGLEFANELCEIAKVNCAAYKANRGFSTKCRIIECDVVNYTINTDENVFFMFNPLDETILT